MEDFDVMRIQMELVRAIQV